MAVYEIAGKPGSGKSFWVVCHLLKKYFYYEAKFQEWFPRGDVQIISNIDDLKLEHYKLDELIEKAGGLEKCFCIEYQKKLLERKGKLLYVIDEANKYFDETVKSKDIHFFFQYHRHLGIDMYLITTGVSLMGNYVNRAAEYRIQAHPRSKSMGGFLYTKVVEGDRMGKMFLRPDERVFRLYRSMSKDEVEPPKSLIKRYLVLVVFFVFVSVLAVAVVFRSFKSGLGVEKKVEVKKALSSSQVLNAGVNIAVRGSGGLIESGKEKIGGFSLVKEGPEVVKEWLEIYLTHDVRGNVVGYTNYGVLTPLVLQSCRDSIKIVGGRAFVPESKVRPPIERKRWAAGHGQGGAVGAASVFKVPGWWGAGGRE